MSGRGEAVPQVRILLRRFLRPQFYWGRVNRRLLRPKELPSQGHIRQLPDKTQCVGSRSMMVETFQLMEQPLRTRRSQYSRESLGIRRWRATDIIKIPTASGGAPRPSQKTATDWRLQSCYLVTRPDPATAGAWRPKLFNL